MRLLFKLLKKRASRGPKVEPVLENVGEAERVPGSRGLAAHPDIFLADPHSFRTAYRRQAWLLRLCVGCCIAMAVCLVAALQTISAAFPLKTTEIALLRADPADNRIYRVAPISQEVDGFQLMMEMMARRFVVNLLSIDGLTQNDRFDDVRNVADRTFFNRFINEHKNIIKRALGDGLNRSVTVRGSNFVKQINSEVYQYVVDFTQTDRVNDGPSSERRLRAYLNLSPRPQDVSEADKFDNPLGIKVLDLQVKEEPTSK